MNYHEITFSHDYPRLILERGRNALDEIKKAIATRFDMGAMLNVMGRPVTLSRRIIAPVEQRIKSLQDEFLVFCLKCVLHTVLFV